VTADRWSDLFALLAGVVGLLIVFRTWPRLPRRAHAARLRHPSAPSPVGVVLDTSGDAAHWRVITPPGSLPTSVDIVTWRPVGSSEEWRSEPIVEPVVLEPGASAVLPLVVDDPTSAHLVVVAWTVQHPGGDVQGSRTLTVATTSSPPTAAAPANRGSGWALLVTSALVAGLLVVLVLVAGWRVLDRDALDGRSATTPIPSAVSSPAPNAAPITTNSTTDSTTDITNSPTVTSPTVTSPTETSPTETSPTVTSPTVTSTVGTSTPVPDADGRSIDVRGRVEECRFGADCVIASFSAVGFPDQGDYVCEFDDGSRVTFRYAGGGALDACATSGAAPSITIEIDGVRSATITREAPDGG
jgi:hypothetical protein